MSNFALFPGFVDLPLAPFMMLSNIPVRRMAPRDWPAYDPMRETFVSLQSDLSVEAEAEGEGRRSNRPGNSQAKGPRSGDELLESETASLLIERVLAPPKG